MEYSGFLYCITYMGVSVPSPLIESTDSMINYPGHLMLNLRVLRHERSWVFCTDVSMQTVLPAQFFNCILHLYDHTRNMHVLSELLTWPEISEHWKASKSLRVGWLLITGL